MSYCPETGEFRWRERIHSSANPGELAGTVEKNGRRKIQVDGCRQMASVLAWLYMTGAWPEELIDHRDNNASNDRFGNLRLASDWQNCLNARRRCDNTSGFKGVKLDRRRGRWQAMISVANKKRKSLGYFDTPEAAGAAYQRAAVEFHGEFARC